MMADIESMSDHKYESSMLRLAALSNHSMSVEPTYNSTIHRSGVAQTNRF